MKQSISAERLSDLTVLILTHNRQNCLSSSLRYWEELGVRTLVLDESPKPFKPQQPLQSSKYLYIKESFAKRCKIAATLLDTKYSIVVSDDELYTPSGLKKMISELEQDQDLVSVGGVAIAVWRYGPQIAASWPYRGTFRYENFERTPLTRIRKHTGEGRKPLSAFFTSNINRTKFLKDCLLLYSKSPTIATEAISILTICAAGKSKFIDSIFWVRNWNEFPKSHANWDRSIYLHDWWRDKRGTPEWNLFYDTLKEAYSEISSDSNFDEVWDLILSANEVAQPKIMAQEYIGNNLYDSYSARYFKYFAKKLIGSRSIPKNVNEVLAIMSAQGVEFDYSEVSKAIEIVSSMRPYKNWN